MGTWLVVMEFEALLMGKEAKYFDDRKNLRDVLGYEKLSHGQAANDNFATF